MAPRWPGVIGAGQGCTGHITGEQVRAASESEADCLMRSPPNASGAIMPGMLHPVVAPNTAPMQGSAEGFGRQREAKPGMLAEPGANKTATSRHAPHLLTQVKPSLTRRQVLHA